MAKYLKSILGDLISLTILASFMPIKYLILRENEISYLYRYALIGFLLIVFIIIKLFEKLKRKLKKKESFVILCFFILSTLASFFVFLFLGPCELCYLLGLNPTFYIGRLIKFYLGKVGNKNKFISEFFFHFFLK